MGKPFEFCQMETPALLRGLLCCLSGLWHSRWKLPGQSQASIEHATPWGQQPVVSKSLSIGVASEQSKQVLMAKKDRSIISEEGLGQPRQTPSDHSANEGTRWIINIVGSQNVKPCQTKMGKVDICWNMLKLYDILGEAPQTWSFINS